MNEWNQRRWRGLGWLLVCRLGEEIPLAPACRASSWMLSAYNKDSLFQLPFPTASSRVWSSPRYSQWQDPRQAPWELDPALKLWLQQEHREIVRACSKVILHRKVPLRHWAIKSQAHFKCQKQVEKQGGENLFYGKPFALLEFFTSFFDSFVWDGLSSAGTTLHVVLYLYPHLLFKLF